MESKSWVGVGQSPNQEIPNILLVGFQDSQVAKNPVYLLFPPFLIRYIYGAYPMPGSHLYVDYEKTDNLSLQCTGLQMKMNSPGEATPTELHPRNIIHT